jgi:hypothetical protein
VKKQYTPPAIEELGSVLELTLAVGQHGAFDQTFPQGQPIPPNFGTS